MLPKHEERITLQDAAKRLAMSYASLWGWARRGHNGRKLETDVIGSRGMRTSIEACHRFTAFLEQQRDARDALKDAQRGAATAPPTRKARARGGAR